MEQINSMLSGAVMPALLIVSGIYFAVRLRFFFILHPLRALKDIVHGEKDGGATSFRALSQALAGTLGVGNMAGVATALTAGGAGSIFWMVLSALAAMSVKYAEVALGVLCRRKEGKRYFGGAMYYIEDIFSRISPRLSRVAGVFFALLCIANTLVTGNSVQMSAAAGAVPRVPPLIVGVFGAVFALVCAVGRENRVSRITAFLIPLLCAGYITVSLGIIICSKDRIPQISERIWREAFSLRAAAGGGGGYAVSRALRYGVTRGIMSNEAGMGSSPTAHAAANTKSPHHQGCFGIFEVFFDTVVLCTMTALVILLSDGLGRFDGIALTLYAYSSLAGETVGNIMSLSVVLFAFASVICSMQYGKEAVGYIVGNKKTPYLYYILSVAATVLGCVAGEGVLWQAADLTVALMTAVNVCCLHFGFSRVIAAWKMRERALK